MASPGQILVFSETGMDDCGIQWITRDSVGVLSRTSEDSNKESRENDIAIEILKLGDFLIRGMKDVKRVYQVFLTLFCVRLCCCCCFRQGCRFLLEWMKNA